MQTFIAALVIEYSVVVARAKHVCSTTLCVSFVSTVDRQYVLEVGRTKSADKSRQENLRRNLSQDHTFLRLHEAAVRTTNTNSARWSLSAATCTICLTSDYGK